MQTLEEINAAISKLEAAKVQLVKDRDTEMKAKLKAFVFEYDWSATWPHPAQCCIERKLSDECQARVAAFIAEHGADYPPKGFVGGMTYSILIDAKGNKYAIGGGGSVIVEFSDVGEYRSSFNPAPITEDIYQALQRGEVPFHIRRP